MPGERIHQTRFVRLAPGASARDQAQALSAEVGKLRLLLETAGELASELSLDLLMSRIVERTSKIMGCERSSVFLVDEERQELFALVAQGLDSAEFRFPLSSGLAGWVARTGQPLNVLDAHQDPRFNPEFDRKTGFRTRAVLALPLQDRTGRRLGVIQCLNKLQHSGPVCFDATDQIFLSALAGLVAVFLDNAKLYRSLDQLLESAVAAFSRSIDDRDPVTSGHSRRVALMTLNLARAVHDAAEGPFAGTQYTRERLRQLRYAALLHDIGKIGVREPILCKADKLPPLGLQLIRERLERFRAEKRAGVLERALAARGDPARALTEEYQPFSREVDRALALVAARNVPGAVSDQDLAELRRLQEKGWLTSPEHECLSIRYGNLTASELADMRNHVVKTHEMLVRIPWPAGLAEVPEVAWTHHERRDGAGYPRGLKQEEIHFDGQCMAVADVYDALTATDRPYKKAVPHETARRIICEDAARGGFRPELVALFFDKECFRLPDVEQQERIFSGRAGASGLRPAVSPKAP